METMADDTDGDVKAKKKGGRPQGRKRKNDVYTRRKPPNLGSSAKYSRKDCPLKEEATGPVPEEEAMVEDVPPILDDKDSDDEDVTSPIPRGLLKVDYEESEDDEDSILDEDDFTPDQLESFSRGEMDDNLDRPHDKNGCMLLSAEDERSRRMGIYHFFKTLYKCMPEESGWWHGRNGIAARIARKMELPPTTNLRPIKNTMRVILRYIEMGVEYNGQYAPRTKCTGLIWK